MATIDDITALAHQLILPEMPNQLVNANYFYYCIMREGRRKRETGGTFIQQPIKIKKNAAAGFIAGDSTSTIDNNSAQQFSNAQFNWKYFYYNVVVTLEELTKAQNTREAIKDIAVAKAEGAIEDAVQTISEALHGNGTDSSGNAFNGLGDLFAASGVAYGGITDTDSGFGDWLASIDTATNTVNYTALSGMLNELSSKSTMYGMNLETKRPRFAPDVIISNYAVRDKYMVSQQGNQNYYNTRELDSGFDLVRVNGVPWMVDSYSPGTIDNSTTDNFCYIMSTESVNFVYKYGLDTDSPVDAQQTAFNQPIKNNVSYLVGNITCKKRNSNGVFKTLVA